MDNRKFECYANSFKQSDEFCPRVFDGYLCWPATLAGKIAEQDCPHAEMGNINTDFMYKVTKQCGLNGTWFVDPSTNSSLADYSQCNFTNHSNNTSGIPSTSDLDEVSKARYMYWVPILKSISIYGYFISIATLLTCIAIFISIKKLRCSRNVLHMHLFISFTMRAILWLIKEFLFENGIGPKSELVTSLNGKITQNFNWPCKAITSTWFYFMQANYMFILMEGIYLHNLMFMNLFSENSSVRYYCIFGWGIPLCFIPIWIALRAEYDNAFCWTTNKNKYISWLVQKPIDFSVAINFVLFISITRILCIKINSMYVQHNKIKYRRLIRSTLTLLLIYAVPYAISVCVGIVLTYYHDVIMELIWIACDQIFTAFQGLLMGLIYCLLNGEVRSELMQKVYAIQRYRKNAMKTRATRTISNTLQFTIPIQDELDARRNAGNYYKTSDLL